MIARDGTLLPRTVSALSTEYDSQSRSRFTLSGGRGGDHDAKAKLSRYPNPQSYSIGRSRRSRPPQPSLRGSKAAGSRSATGGSALQAPRTSEQTAESWQRPLAGFRSHRRAFVRIEGLPSVEERLDSPGSARIRLDPPIMAAAKPRSFGCTGYNVAEIQCSCRFDL